MWSNAYEEILDIVTSEDGDTVAFSNYGYVILDKDFRLIKAVMLMHSTADMARLEKKGLIVLIRD